MQEVQSAGQLFMLGIDGHDPEPLRPLVEEFRPGGIILFNHNIASLAQVQNLTGTLQDYAIACGLPPLLVSADQEGGRVTRLGPELCPAFPSNWQLGADYASSGDTAPVVHQAEQTAAALLRCGININLAPVLDVVTVEGNTVIADRSYGAGPALAGRLGCAYIEALQTSGVIATAKHFPGHGPTAVDSHTDLPRVELDEAELRERHLAPFRAAVASGVAAIMPAHIIYEAWDGWPTTLSHRILTGLLREELGFEGVVVTDDLNMHAISKHYPYPESIVQALQAGVDLLLVCTDTLIQRAALSAVRDALANGKLDSSLVAAAQERINRLKQYYLNKLRS